MNMSDIKKLDIEIQNKVIELKIQYLGKNF